MRLNVAGQGDYERLAFMIGARAVYAQQIPGSFDFRWTVISVKTRSLKALFRFIFRHSRASGRPWCVAGFWIPAFAGIAWRRGQFYRSEDDARRQIAGPKEPFVELPSWTILGMAERWLAHVAGTATSRG